MRISLLHILRELSLRCRDPTVSNALPTPTYEWDDTENADMDGNFTISLTATCLSDCFEYRVLNSRRYYTFSEAKHCYLLPSDIHEEERLQILQLYWLQPCKIGSPSRQFTLYSSCISSTWGLGLAFGQQALLKIFLQQRSLAQIWLLFSPLLFLRTTTFKSLLVFIKEPSMIIIGS